jgi:signal transduction histidine kinase
VVGFDVTDEVRARDELSRTLRYNEMFAGILGHDLRNPLGSIMTAAQLLLRRSSDERLVAPAARILASGERMSRMIEQLLDFTRIRIGGGLNLDRRRFDVVEILRRVVAEVEAAADGRKFHIESMGDTHGDWDGDRLSQVFSNLAGNAVQHGSKSGPVRVHIDGRAAHAISMSFSNKGLIPETLLSGLFDAFRGTENKRSNANGLGLGLFISKEIVVAHGGDIQVSSKDGESCFTIVLPRSSGLVPESQR